MHTRQQFHNEVIDDGNGLFSAMVLTITVQALINISNNNLLLCEMITYW